MSLDYDEAQRLRERTGEDEDYLAQGPPEAMEGAPCRMARTKAVGSYPNVAAAYYGVETQSITGAEVEGGPATITTDGNTLYAYNLGNAVPPQGTAVIITRIRNRWVFRYDG